MIKTTENPEKTSLTWWQWIVIYPTLFVAILGSIPTLIDFSDSIKLHSHYDQVQMAREQQKFWNKNFECTQKSPMYWSESDDPIKIGVTLCPSKDILVAVNGNIEPYYRWLGFNTFNPTQQFANRLMPAVFAAELPDPINLAQRSEKTTVLCQKQLSNNKILRRVKKSDGRCFDQTVHTPTGKILKEVLVECSSDCDQK